MNKDIEKIEDLFAFLAIEDLEPKENLEIGTYTGQDSDVIITFSGNSQ